MIYIRMVYYICILFIILMDLDSELVIYYILYFIFDSYLYLFISKYIYLRIIINNNYNNSTDSFWFVFFNESGVRMIVNSFPFFFSMKLIPIPLRDGSLFYFWWIILFYSILFYSWMNSLNQLRIKYSKFSNSDTDLARFFRIKKCGDPA